MSKKALATLVAMSVIASSSYEEPIVKRGLPAKSPLSKKGKKLRQKNKAASKSRQINRKK